jgi:hypothetical protein
MRFKLGANLLAADEGAGSGRHEAVAVAFGLLALHAGAAFGLAEGRATSSVRVVHAVTVVAEKAVRTELEFVSEGGHGSEEGDSHYEFFHFILSINFVVDRKFPMARTFSLIHRLVN